MEAFADAISDIVENEHPITCRRVFYVAESRGLVEKTEEGCAAVERMLIKLRREGTLTYDAIVDATRCIDSPMTWDSPTGALEYLNRVYRRDAWEIQPERVMVLLEKVGLHEAARAITWPYRVPLVTCKGYSSLSQLNEAANLIEAADAPWHIMHFGDWDPSGENIGDTAEKTIREMAPAAEIHFQRRALTPNQIDEWNLPTRPTKQSDSRAKNFSGESVEIDVLPIAKLQELIEQAILEHIDPDAWAEHTEHEEKDKGRLAKLTVCDDAEADDDAD